MPSTGVFVLEHPGSRAASSLQLGCCQCAAGARWWCRQGLGTRSSDHPCPGCCPGRLFWVPLLEEEENPHGGNASFPTPARGKHPPASSAAPNSPLFIQVRRALKSVMSSWMSELVVAAGKARTSPVRQCHLFHSHPVRTACRPLCSRQTHHLIPALRCCR